MLLGINDMPSASHSLADIAKKVMFGLVEE